MNPYLSKIKWGDRIRTKIDKGLKKSKFGVVILSRSYISKYWTNYEFFSPSLAGKMAMNTAFMPPKELAEKLYELLYPKN